MLFIYPVSSIRHEKQGTCVDLCAFSEKAKNVIDQKSKTGSEILNCGAFGLQFEKFGIKLVPGYVLKDNLY